MKTLIKTDVMLHGNNPMKKIEKEVFHIESIAELENDLDITDLFTSDYYLSSGDLSGIIEDIADSGIDIYRLASLVKSELGYSQWSIRYVENEDMYILINEWV